MKVLHVGDNVISGHRFNGHDLGKALREIGHESEHIVWNKNFEDEYTFEMSKEMQSRNLIHNLCYHQNKAKGSNSLFYPFSYDLLFNDKFLNCDVVHLHLIHNNFFSIEHLPIITRLKPVVWTLHDPWALTGHCIYPLDCNKWETGCGDCPNLKLPFDIEVDSTALNWEYKKIIFQASNFDIIVASDWMQKRVKKSVFFTDKTSHLINFGLDLNKFKPFNSLEAKRKLGIPEKNIVISFRSTQSPFKGLDYICQCLRKLNSDVPISLLVFNEKGLLSEFQNRFQIIELGWVVDDDAMINAYNAADVFLMPSVAEAFGMMAMEAMACGKPVIAMDGTSLPEVLWTDKSNCIVVPQGDVDGMLHQLEILIKDCNLRFAIGLASRKVAEEYYSKDLYVKRIENAYSAVIKRQKKDTHINYLIEQQKSICSNIQLVPAEAQSNTKVEKFMILMRRITENKYTRTIALVILYPLINLLYNFYLILFKKRNDV